MHSTTYFVLAVPYVANPNLKHQHLTNLGSKKKKKGYDFELKGLLDKST